MDKDGLIYLADDVPEDDAARLDGYLRGRAESDAQLKKAREQYEETLREFKEAESG